MELFYILIINNINTIFVPTGEITFSMSLTEINTKF